MSIELVTTCALCGTAGAVVLLAWLDGRRCEGCKKR
jgi:hypothetical protein